MDISKSILMLMLRILGISREFQKRLAAQVESGYINYIEDGIVIF